MASIEVAPEFGYVLLVAIAIGFQVILMGGVAGRKRKQEKFKSVKYPDNGCGIWGNKLPEADWIEFNNYQRVHYNYVEGVASVLVFLFVSGFWLPCYSAIAGAAYVVGRQLYAIGYWKKGAQGRIVGAIILDAALLLLLGGAIRNAVYLAFKWF